MSIQWENLRERRQHVCTKQRTLFSTPTSRLRPAHRSREHALKVCQRISKGERDEGRYSAFRHPSAKRPNMILHPIHTMCIKLSAWNLSLLLNSSPSCFQSNTRRFMYIPTVRVSALTHMISRVIQDSPAAF
ncbi:unnamed protein product, partial [Ectocarpus fasciculatus]